MSAPVIPKQGFEQRANERVAQWREPSSNPDAMRRSRTANILALPGLYLAVAGGFAVGVNLGFVSIFVLVVAPALFLLWGSIQQFVTHNEATLEDASFLEDNESWLAQVWVVQNGVVTGTDRGVVWSDQGAVGFVGHRTSFVVTREDVDPSYSLRVRLHGCYDQITDRYVLSLRQPAGPRWQRRNVYLFFRLLKPPSGYDVAESGLLAKCLLELTDQASSLDPQFPPLTPGPGAERLPLLVARVLAPYVLILGLPLFWLGSVFWSEMTPSTAEWVGFVIVLTLLGFGIARSMARTWRVRLDAMSGILWEEIGYQDRFARIEDWLKAYSYFSLAVLIAALSIVGGVTLFGMMLVQSFSALSYLVWILQLLGGLFLTFTGCYTVREALRALRRYRMRNLNAIVGSVNND